jgi:hypothetical protein
LNSDINGGFNTATGVLSLFSNTSGFFNSATGAYSLANNTIGNNNTANGYGALYRNTADHNTATGFAALYKNTIGTDNTATGYEALFSNIAGIDNTANGSGALDLNATGNSNTAIGSAALESNTGGNNNTAIGFLALSSNTTATSNTAVGWSALSGNTTGFSNIALGAAAGVSVATANEVICIGTNVSGEDVSHSCYIGSIFGQTSSGGSAVYINSNGRLGTLTSSARFKKEIKPMDESSTAILALKPVTFRYTHEIDPKGIPQFGLVAEDVEAVNPDLVVRDKEGKVNTVRYEAVNAMLLNEFLKEHRKVEEQEATIAQMKKGMDTLVAHIKEQDSKIQKVSDRVEMSTAATQVAAIK